MMALATRYEVSAQAASSVLTERLPAMCGSETFTTVVSSTSMKVANMTATATIHGLTWGCGSAADGILSLAFMMPQNVAQKKGARHRRHRRRALNRFEGTRPGHGVSRGANLEQTANFRQKAPKIGVSPGLRRIAGLRPQNG